LPIGGVSLPFESQYGIEIARRTPNRERPRYAMEAIKLAFIPGDPESKRAAYEAARQTLELLKTNPRQFDEVRRKHCCAKPESWFEGRDEPGLSRAVARLELNEMASAPVEQYATWVIPKRIDPNQVAPQLETKFLVPSPERPNLEWVLRRLPVPLLAKEIAELAEAYPGITVSDRSRKLLQELLRLADPAQSSPSAESSVSQFVASVHELFEEKDAAQYRTILEDRIGSRMLVSAGKVR
jgi:hypothetical protein